MQMDIPMDLEQLSSEDELHAENWVVCFHRIQ